MAAAVSFGDWLGLPYEQKHAVAARWVAAQQTEGEDGGGLLTEDASLALWALGQQLEHGDNAEEKPSFWEVTASAKWSAYDSLRGTSKLDAMRKFISILDQDLGPRWPVEHASELVAATLAGGVATGSGTAAPTSPLATMQVQPAAQAAASEATAARTAAPAGVGGSTVATVDLIHEQVEGSDDSNQTIENRQKEAELGDEDDD